MRLRLITPIILALVLLSSAPAPAQTPFAPLPAPPPSQQTVPTSSTPQSQTDSSSGGGLSAGIEILLFGVGALLLGGIAWVIVRDARRAAPVGERAARQGSTTKPGADRARARAKAKAARRQRKRNR